MKIDFIDHIVIIVKNIPATENFYTSFLGAPEYVKDGTLVYKIGDTKLFFVLPKAEFEPADKDKSGLNHIAFGVRTIGELKSLGSMLDQATIKHSGIKTDVHGNKDYIWFDDPDNYRVELYCRPVE
jgi:glyoxylase I family protein